MSTVAKIIYLFISCIFNTTTQSGILTTEEITILEQELKDLYDQHGEDDIKLELASSVIQLIFHDCVGSHSSSNPSIISICDGCVDIDNIYDDNHGNLYQDSIEPLEAIYLHSNLSLHSKISRSDFWSFAASHALFLKKQNSPAPAPLDEIPYYFGRTDCETTPNINTSTITKHKTLPDPNDGWSESYEFLRENLNFSIKDAIAMIGLHTIGFTHRDGDGFGLDSSWTNIPGKLVHNYYVNIYNRPYHQTFIAQNDNEYWNPSKNNYILALNVDIGMLYNIDDNLNASSECDAINLTLSDCVGYNMDTLEYYELFTKDNHEWLIAMRQAFIKMITIGYDEIELTAVWKPKSETLHESDSLDPAVIIGIVIGVIVVMMGILFLFYKLASQNKSNSKPVPSKIPSNTRTHSGKYSGYGDEQSPLNSPYDHGIAITPLQDIHNKDSGHDINAIKVTNALVVIIGIAEYDTNHSKGDEFLQAFNFSNLPIIKDIENLKSLFSELNYTIYPKGDKIKLHWKESEIVQLLKDVGQQLMDEYDGLIVCISCHGIRNHIITSDIKALEKTVIHRIISVHHPKVREIPRVFLFDCCDGGMEKQRSISISPKCGDERSDKLQQLQRRTSQDYGKYISLDDVKSEQIWTTHQKNPDFRLVEIHAANPGFQAKMHSEKGSYLLSEFTKRMKRNLKKEEDNDNEMEKLGRMFDKIQDDLHEAGKQQTQNVFNNNTRYVIFRKHS